MAGLPDEDGGRAQVNLSVPPQQCGRQKAETSWQKVGVSPRRLGRPAESQPLWARSSVLPLAGHQGAGFR